MKTLRTMSTTGVVAAVVAGLAGSAAGAVPAGWAATRTLAHAPAYAVASDAGPLADAEPLGVAIALPVRDAAGLAARAAAGGAAPPLTTREFLDRHAPTADQVTRVVAYLRGNGFQNIVVADNRLLVTADGTAVRVRTAFRAELHAFDVGGRRAFANVTDALVPASLADSVLAVVGLQTVHLAHTNAKRFERTAATVQATAQTVTGVSPTLFASIYGASGMASATTATIGIVTQGSMTQTVADLNTFAANAGFPAPSVSVVTVGKASADTSGVDEWNLDTQSSLAAAGGTVASIKLYTAATLSDSNLLAAYNKAVSDNVARVVNVSLGECETSAKTSGAMAAMDQVFQAAVAQGQTFSVAAGDSGSYECGGSGNSQSYPAVSPWVMAIGGTTLSSSGGTWAGETAWSCSSATTCPQSASGGTGGGVSLAEPAPSWQTNAGVLATAGQRGVPDIAFDAAPASGAIVLIAGKSYQIGGTSLSAPLFTGFYSRIQSAHGNALGFPAATIYAGAASNPAWFHDVTAGSNGGYSAAAGWDYVTGWGSLQVQNFSGALAGGGSALTASFSCTPSGLTVSCTDGSTDPGGSIAAVAWSFGDGGTASGATPSHTYAAAGTYTVTETVTEAGTGRTATQAASVTVAAAAPAWTTFAAEGQAFTIDGSQTVRYGAGSSWITLSVTGSGTCSNAFFGTDPIDGTVKSCQVVSTGVGSAWAQVATENQGFTVDGTQTVRYGAGSAWITKTVTGSGTCSNAFFGTDPVYGTVKRCQVSAAGGGSTTPVTWTRIAVEGQSFTLGGTQTVRYGAGSSYVTRSISAGGVCSNDFFGTDPLYGTVKACDVAN